MIHSARLRGRPSATAKAPTSNRATSDPQVFTEHEMLNSVCSIVVTYPAVGAKYTRAKRKTQTVSTKYQYRHTYLSLRSNQLAGVLGPTINASPKMTTIPASR